MQIAYPFQIDTSHRTATTDDATHVRDMIEQVLFTTPGERVNRPTFGSGLLTLAFAPASDQLAATVQFLAQGALTNQLSDLVRVDRVEASIDDSTLTVTVRYVILSSQAPQVSQFSRTI
jgi:phage baseplate assembly protein W